MSVNDLERGSIVIQTWVRGVGGRGLVWCGVMWCGVVLCYVVLWCGVVWFCLMRCGGGGAGYGAVWLWL